MAWQKGHSPISDKLLLWLRKRRGQPFTYRVLARYLYRENSTASTHRARSLFNVFRRTHPEVRLLIMRAKLRDGTPGRGEALFTYVGERHEATATKKTKRPTTSESPTPIGSPEVSVQEISRIGISQSLRNIRITYSREETRERRA